MRWAGDIDDVVDAAGDPVMAVGIAEPGLLAPILGTM
jgi:hypothetical protein